MTDPIAPEPLIEAPRSARRRLSPVWLVPLIALAISLVVAWRTYSERGPLIEIVFDSAAGIEAGQTQIRFRDIGVGVVEDVGFTDDLQQVVVQARIEQEAARYLDAGALFWVVRPSVTAQGVSGIETVISGVYIQAYWDAEIGPRQRSFEALERPPLTPADQPGLRVRLRAPEGGSVVVGAPVLFNSIEVGQVESVQLTEAGDVMIDLFVEAPHDRRLTTATRFWDASGFSVELSAAGAALNVDSLISLVRGGVAFDTVTTGGEPIEAEHVFQLYPAESAARQSIVEADPESQVPLSIYFDGSVRGLQLGAAVEFRGVPVGEVTDIAAQVRTDAEGAQVVETRTEVMLNARRMGLSGDDLPARTLALLQERVRQGLRARLASANLLTGALYVDLADLPDAPPAELALEAEPYPVLPSAPSEDGDIAGSAQGVLDRVAALPVEELLDATVTLLGNVNQLITDEGVRTAPQNLGLLLADLRALVGQDAVQQAPAELAALIASLRGVVEDVTERELVASLAEALEGTQAAVEDVGAAVEGLPALIDELSALAAKAGALPLDELIASADRLVDDLDALVRSDAVAALPASLDAALAELRGLIGALREGGAVENATATLASLRAIAGDLAEADLTAQLAEAIEAARRAAVNAGTASEALPALAAELTALSDRLTDLPYDALVTSANDVLQSVDAILSDEEIATLPVALRDALRDVEAILEQLQEGGAVENVNATLASAEDAAAAVQAAAADLPALVARFDAVAAQAEVALAQIGPGSTINRDTEAVLREVRAAARAVTSLVSALERRPNSVLFGR